MPYTIQITHAAKKDIRDAFIWYDQQRKTLGTSFENNIVKAIKSIQDNPFSFQKRYGQTRICFLKRFPYGIHYQLKGNEILIIAIFHTSLNPEKWEKR